jgi:signal transduction histidine kinase
MVDVSQTILYEQVFAENQFLAITNATVSHELRNPLQSISAQNLKINLCLKEILSILKTEQNATVKEVSKPLKELVNMIE